eukprot:6276009-Prymnesium_polylepis.1
MGDGAVEMRWRAGAGRGVRGRLSRRPAMGGSRDSLPGRSHRRRPCRGRSMQRGPRLARSVLLPST